MVHLKSVNQTKSENGFPDPGFRKIFLLDELAKGSNLDNSSKKAQDLATRKWNSFITSMPKRRFSTIKDLSPSLTGLAKLYAEAICRRIVEENASF